MFELLLLYATKKKDQNMYVRERSEFLKKARPALTFMPASAATRNTHWQSSFAPGTTTSVRLFEQPRGKCVAEDAGLREKRRRTNANRSKSARWYHQRAAKKSKERKRRAKKKPKMRYYEKRTRVLKCENLARSLGEESSLKGSRPDSTLIAERGMSRKFCLPAKGMSLGRVQSCYRVALEFE